MKFYSTKIEVTKSAENCSYKIESAVLDFPTFARVQDSSTVIVLRPSGIEYS